MARGSSGAPYRKNEISDAHIQCSLSLVSLRPYDVTGQRMSLYADDLVIFLLPKPEDFTCLRAVLDLFAGASGLITNLDKCLISPIRCSEDDIAAVHQVFPCQLAPFPCRYLGAPLTVGRLRRADETAARGRHSTPDPDNLLNVAGRTTLTRATLSAIYTGARVHYVLPFYVGH
jgi:hypothetical protein